MDANEPHWRTNSSFSPPQSRIWDCRLQSDTLPREVPLYGLSLSSNSKGSRSRVSSEQYPNHHHSVSDGVLSYFGSPPENFQASRLTPPVLKSNFDEFATPLVGGSRPGTSLHAPATETRFTAGLSTSSNSFMSPSPVSESGQWESTSRRPISFPPRNFSSRRSFMSKPVYPLVFQNPVSDSDASGSADTGSGSRLTPPQNRSSPVWPDSASSFDLKFHKTLTDLQKMEASPDPSTSSRREGFRWSNASSYDFGFDGDSIDITEQVDLESLPSLNNTFTEDQKCGLCGRLLWQKSPWSSYRIVRSSDMPIAGILPCSHVFHAECLEQTTPKAQIHDPPCPVCMKSISKESPSFSEPLQMALRSIRRKQGLNIAADDAGNTSNQSSDPMESGLKRNLSLPVPQPGGSSLIKNHFKKHFSFKGKKTGKDLFSAKMFRRTGSSFSVLGTNQNAVGSSRTGQSSKN